MNIFNTIVPIFSVIFLGWVARSRGFIPVEFIGPANRLAFFLAIPAMIFNAITQGSFSLRFSLPVLLISLICVFFLFFAAWAIALLLQISRQQTGVFVQSCFHGNLGFIGLAVAFYFLGQDGLIRASILAGFIMVLQNLLAVVILQLFADSTPFRWTNIPHIMLRVIGNPIIISAMLGILFSLLQIPVPTVIRRCLDILSGLGLPTALLLIGATLSFRSVHEKLFHIAVSGTFKLILLPGIALFLCRLFSVQPANFLPGIILLASPTATVTYVMAREMNSDMEFAGSAISFSTLFSALTFIFWINLIH